MTANWTYGNRGELLEVNNASPTGTISRYVYTYDAAGRRIACAKSGTAFNTPDTNSYRYNARSELTNATATVDAAYRYTYDFDDIGNREGSSERGTNSVYTANSLNQYASITNISTFQHSNLPTFQPTFDADGNETIVKTATGIWNVIYNGENRPVRWTQGDTVITMSFDRMGRRVTKNDQRFVYNGYLQIANFHCSPSSFTSVFVWDPTEEVATRPLVWTRNGVSSYYDFDGNKDVSEVIDSDGTLAAHYEYAPFGALTVSSGISAAVNPWRFSSEYAEDDTATIYYNYRHYEPVTGRWMSRDLHDSKKLLPHPVYDSGTTYIYVSNMPIGGTDLLGLNDGFRDCTAPKVWTTKQKGGTVPPADGCSVPAFVEKLLTGTKDNPTGFASFLDACNYHDTCYSNCQKDKDTCDNEFFTKMLLACANATARIADGKERQKKREQCDKWAGIYYNAVGAFGDSAYERRQRLNCECRCP